MQLLNMALAACMPVDMCLWSLVLHEIACFPTHFK